MTNLKEFVEICARHGAVLVVDDAHGSGTMGTHGRGTLEAMGLEGQVKLKVTLPKHPDGDVEDLWSDLEQALKKAAPNVQTGQIKAEGRVLNCGRRVGMAEGRVTDAKGRLLAHGTTTCLIFPS